MDPTALTLHQSWALTAAISPRRMVRAAAGDTTGGVLNSYPHVHPTTGRLPTTPWAVCLADAQGRFRLLCFDLDAKPDPRQVDHDGAELTRLLDDQQLPHVVCQSGPSGGVHVWLAVRDGVDAELVAVLTRLLTHRLPTLDPSPLLNPATGCVRPPEPPTATAVRPG